MTNHPDRTVWFPKDMLLFVLLTIPWSGIVGLGWGLVMALCLGGSLFGWLFTGLLFGATMWVIFAILWVVMARELSTSVPLQEVSTLPGRLGGAVKLLTYVVEQQSPTWFVCRPKYGLVRFFSCSKLHVLVRDGRADLTGPAFVVKRVRKKLLVASPTIPI